jgi:2-oxoglutarate dehydrogenase E2 component (dihydrolipoamide succinyltransferase)
MHTIQRRPAVVGEEIMARPLMYVALTYDHRLVDGKDSVSFLVKLKKLVEDPMEMLLEM